MPVLSEQTQDPHPWPAARRVKVVQDLVQGSDTVAGVAHRYGLPVRTILQWLPQGPRPDGLADQDVEPRRSRMAGPA